MEAINADRLSELVQDAIDGRESALKALAILRGQKDLIEQGIKEIEAAAMDEAQRYGEKTFEDHGFRFELRAGGKMWNFKECAVWAKKKEELSVVEEELKAAWQSAQHGNMSVDSQGEVIDLPEVTYRKDSIVIKPV